MKSTSILLSIVAAVTTTFVLSNSSAYADCTGDLNNNNFVDGVDLAILLNDWNSSNPQSDINSDGNINGQDLALLMGAWGNCGFSGSDDLTINALGYTWITNSQPIPNPITCDAVAAPPLPNLPNYNSNFWLPANVDTVALGSSCALRLTLARNSGCYWQSTEIWAAAQAVLALPTGTSLAYGKILVTIKPVGGWAPFIGGCTGLNQNTTTTLGIFTYDKSSPPPFNEIDIVEVGYQNQNSTGSWINGQPSTPPTTDAQFCVQPWDAGNLGNPNWNNVHRISLDPLMIPTSDEVTFMVDWQQGSLTFNAAYGQYTKHTFPAKPPISWRTVSSSTTPIPVPTPTMSLYINLWPYGGPTTGAQVQFLVTHLEVTTTTNP